MQIGERIKISDSRYYTIIKNIAVNNRPNAHIYLCEDEKGDRYVAKYFYNHRPMPNVAYGKKNHYGRRRDGSQSVFEEIKSQSAQHEFLIDHIERVKHNNKWVIILEYINGMTMRDYIAKHISTLSNICDAVTALAKTLTMWHKSGFAHGDPHLDNCMIYTANDGTITAVLIDYCQLHHKSFKYCQKYNCFSPQDRRVKEDLDNTKSHNFGNGFRAELFEIQKTYKLENLLVDKFDRYYFSS